MISGEVERNIVQYRNITKDGRVIWCEWFNSILKDMDGKVKNYNQNGLKIKRKSVMKWD